MKRLFTFKQLRPDAKMIQVVYIDFAGGHKIKYKPPPWEGYWNLWLDDDFFVDGICDGGGYVEVVYPPKKRGREDIVERVLPICPECGADMKHGVAKEPFRFIHRCTKGCESEELS